MGRMLLDRRHRKLVFLLRYKIRRITGEIRFLLPGGLDPGRNAVLLWRQIREKAATLKALLLRRGYPDDPYAMVTARTRPRVPRLSGSVAVDPYQY